MQNIKQNQQKTILHIHYNNLLIVQKKPAFGGSGATVGFSTVVGICVTYFKIK